MTDWYHIIVLVLCSGIYFCDSKDLFCELATAPLTFNAEYLVLV